MKKDYTHKKVLIIQGPNMNLLGYRLKETKTRLTLDKLNAHLRKTAKEIELELIIVQTNDESRAVAELQKLRNKIYSVLLYPGPWQQSGYVIKDTLDILSIPCITVSVGEKEGILKGIKN